jgi:hypothetical protein
MPPPPGAGVVLLGFGQLFFRVRDVGYRIYRFFMIRSQMNFMYSELLTTLLVRAKVDFSKVPQIFPACA